MSRAILALLLLAPACTGRPAATRADSVAVPAPDAPLVTLERRPCFGSCPVYSVSLLGDGTVRFVGKEHVAHQGPATAAVPAAVVESLVSELTAGGYFEFADRYEHAEPACGLYATDSPSVITSVTMGGRTKEIRHDYGCASAPAELGRLERRIDEVARTARWTGR